MSVGHLAPRQATTGGLISAALQSVPGASKYYRAGAKYGNTAIPMISDYGMRGSVYGHESYCLYPKHVEELLLAERAKGTGYETKEAYWERKVSLLAWCESSRR